MYQFAHFRPFRHASVWLLALGLLAMAMHTLGGAGFMPRSSAGGGFLAEICTSKGVSKIDPALLAGKTPLPDSAHDDCCKLCVGSAPVLLADGGIGVPPAPTFSSVFFTSVFPYPAAVVRLSHPPRGPPLA